MKSKYKPLSILPAICIMGIIYSFSAQDATVSGDLSGGIVERIFLRIEDIWNLKLDVQPRTLWTERIDVILRKSAHMSEYAILALSVAFPFFLYGRRGKKLVLTSEIICVLYAITDELHQTFVPGRAGRLIDVIIDGIGALVGCLVFALIATKMIESSNKNK